MENFKLIARFNPEAAAKELTTTNLWNWLNLRKKDHSIKEQTDIYNRKYQEYEQEIKYYKDLCQWHVQQRKQK